VTRARDPDGRRIVAPVVTLDLRLLDAVVEFTTEVAQVAYSLRNLGMHDEAARLVVALDRLDAAGRDDDDSPTG
jgi:hypothetical protein